MILPPSSFNFQSGVYVHIPFCARLCPYCAFPVAVGHDGEQARFVGALLEEAEARSGELKAPAASLNFGGGTPSRLEGTNFFSLVRGLKERLSFTPDLEFSIEANPEDVNRESAAFWKEAGVTRVSLGAQSFDEAELKVLGRIHGPEKILESVSILRQAGIRNINLDLIAGAAPTEAWSESLAAALSLHVEHLSFYILEYEAGTALSRTRMDQRWTEDREGEVILRAAGLLEKQGYEWYELSNFSKPGFRCRYNDGFWKGGDVLGLGPGAVSSLGRGRRRNKRNLTAYLENPIRPEETEDLDSWSLAAEKLLRGLRGSDGVDLASLPLRDEIMANALAREFQGLVKVAANRLFSTIRGRLLADGLARDLMPPQKEVYIHGHEPIPVRHR